jgi:hypothetical protein
MKFYLTPILAVLFTAEANAADWWLIGTDKNGSTYEIDRESVRTENKGPGKSIVIVWSRQDHSRDRTISFRTSKTMYHIKCDKREIAIVSLVRYDVNGNVKHSDTTAFPDFQPVVPDSMGDEILFYACTLSGKP